MAKGVGVGLRAAFQGETDKILAHVDFLEVNQKGNPDVLVNDLQPFLNRLPLVIHSLNLSLGSVELPAQHRLDGLKRAVELLNPSYVSEHLSYSRYGDIEIDSFIALPYIDEAIEVASSNIKHVQKLIGRKLAMENITHNFTWPGSQYSEAEFITRVLEAADCGMLLDVTNLYVNSKVLGYDPFKYLEALPKERIMQLHLAGHSVNDGQPQDSHVGGIHPDVLAFAEWVLRNTSCEAFVVERDNNLTCFDDLMPDLTICKELYSKYRQPVRS